jgi:predicted DNA binding CopG/RHH family protein
MMMKIDDDESEVLVAYDKGLLKSVATKTELAKLRAAARATAVKDRRVNIRLSSGDLSDIQTKAMEEGMPYQTLIASVLHKYVTGRLSESETADQGHGGAAKRRATRRSTGRPAGTASQAVTSTSGRRRREA